MTAADDEVYVHPRHRKLTHQLSRWGQSPRLLLGVERAPDGRQRFPSMSGATGRCARAPVDEQPNRSWRYDITTFPTLAADYHLEPVMDACSRKIVGRHFSPEVSATFPVRGLTRSSLQ